MVGTIKVAKELVTVTGTDGCPLVLGCINQLEIVVEHIGIEHDVVRQTVVLPLGYVSSAVGNLSQISQLGTVGDQVGIFLRTRTTSKGVSHTAVPCQCLLRICIETCCHGNLGIWHRERVDILSFLLQGNFLTRGVIGQYQAGFSHQHVMSEDGLQEYLFPGLGTAKHLQPVTIHGEELDGAAFGVGHGAHVGTITSCLVGITLTYLSQTIDVGIVTVRKFKRVAQQVCELLALHFIGRLGRGVSAIAVDGRVEVQVADCGIIIVNTVVSALANGVAIANTSSFQIANKATSITTRNASVGVAVVHGRITSTNVTYSNTHIGTAYNTGFCVAVVHPGTPIFI